jgi:hypothetical protein
LPIIERARRQVWNARYTLRVVCGLPPEFDRAEARRLRIKMTDLVKRCEATLAALIRPSAPVEVLPPATPEITDRDRIRRSKPESQTGPPRKRKRPRRLLPVEARKPNSPACKADLIPARNARPHQAFEDLDELNFAQQISRLHQLGASALIEFLSLFAAERLLRLPLETALDRYLDAPFQEKKTGPMGGPARL